MSFFKNIQSFIRLENGITVTSRVFRRYNHVQALRDPKIEVRTIDKVLIANRGEIACRVMRTANKLGIQTVAVYSDVDRHSMHVQMADEAYRIGPAPSSQSYLNAEKILEVAKQSGSQAVHPGYGFLSENLEFSERCKNEGIIFVGPPSSAIRDMGIKSTSKAIMEEAGVPIIKGYHGEDQSLERLQAEADKVGFPLMIKAVRGGGGKGMRIALTKEDFLTALDSAKRESMKSFGDDNVLLEQYVNDPRHVEVQVFADQHGNAVHLFERDCSVQRRHQKIIEEAPAPGISWETRRAIGQAAVRAALAVNYVGAGTVEFILDRTNHHFHFMEMNTRLQVEHPITEMITGTDLVEWQLRIAAGEPLPLSQEDITMSGHALESRIYAEDPRGGFMPGAGRLVHVAEPQPNNYVRVETGVRQGDDVSVHYDPMIAKLVVWGRDRTEALARMKQKLADYQIVGLETNVNFLMELCRNKAFQDGDVHTAFIRDHEKDLFPEEVVTDSIVIQAALATVLKSQEECQSNNDSFKGIQVPARSYRLNYTHTKSVQLKHQGKGLTIDLEYGVTPKTFKARVNSGAWLDVEAELRAEGHQHRLLTVIGGNRCTCNVVLHDGRVHLFDKTGKTVLDLAKPKYLSALGTDRVEGEGNTARSPMPGVLDKIYVKPGDQVKKGDPLFVVIAMKMEYVVKAARDGSVETVAAVKVGDSIAKSLELVKFKVEVKDEK